MMAKWRVAAIAMVGLVGAVAEAGTVQLGAARPAQIIRGISSSQWLGFYNGSYGVSTYHGQLRTTATADPFLAPILTDVTATLGARDVLMSFTMAHTASGDFTTTITDNASYVNTQTRTDPRQFNAIFLRSSNGAPLRSLSFSIAGQSVIGTLADMDRTDQWLHSTVDLSDKAWTLSGTFLLSSTYHPGSTNFGIGAYQASPLTLLVPLPTSGAAAMLGLGLIATRRSRRAI